MKTAHEWFNAYGVSHTNPINKIIHWICIPIIMFSLLGMLMAIPIPNKLFSLGFNMASFFLVFALLFYFRLSPKLFFGFLGIGLLMLAGNYIIFTKVFNYNNEMMALFSLILFVGAWIGQFIGHKIEGAKPSFFEDLQFLLIGPAWLLQFVYNKLGIKI